MRYFATLLAFRLKSALCSVSFWICAACFLCLTAAFGLLVPDNSRAGLEIGVLAKSAVGADTADVLLENGDYTVTLYEDEERMGRDLLSGKLHCAYLLSDEWSGTPVTVLETESSYLRPVLDQLVYCAYFEASIPKRVASYLDGIGYGVEDARALLEAQGQGFTPMTVQLRKLDTGAEMGQAKAGGEAQPMLYAVMVSLFTAMTVLNALLSGQKDRAALLQLRRLTGRGISTAAAPAAADSLLNLLLLLAADACLSMLLGGQMLYQAHARLLMLFLLACGTALLALGLSQLRKSAGMAAAAIPLWLLAGMFCSGALVNPASFPAGLGLLRYLSPAWYVLQGMARLSGL